MMRVGTGIDVHRLGGDPPLLLAGVVVDETRGLLGTSDGDVVAHAVADALLGAAALGDMGDHFPSSDPQWHGADSMDLLRRVVTLVFDRAWDIVNVDVTVVAQEVRIAPHREAMGDQIAEALRLARQEVSVKATSTDGLGFIGRDEGIAAVAVAMLSR